ncbi:hypothetical protein GOODEAATRI_019434 [Goodea atripinnis]|uniref:Uncharacterized protein n=1 Tax=Goodea atripinnis TaxID=208336 RepID=A0ABV0Q033_9TELE
MLGLMVPVSCLRRPTSQPQPKGLLLQLDSVPYCQCPPLGSGIAAPTGTADLTATATGSIDNGCGEHGPLGPHVSNTSARDVFQITQIQSEQFKFSFIPIGFHPQPRALSVKVQVSLHVYL